MYAWIFRHLPGPLWVRIIIAIVLRTIFIFVGAAAINRFSWVFYIFGAYLVYVGFKQAFGHDDEGGAPGRPGGTPLRHGARWLRRPPRAPP